SGQTATLGKFPVTLQIKDKENNRSAATFNVTVIPWEEIRINAGGGAIITGDKYWMADNFYSGGISFIPSGPLVLPEDQLGDEALYESERISAGVAGFSYQIPVLENGYFTVELYMRTTPDPAGVDKNPGSGFFYIVIENG